ncbi:Fe-S cluster biogenesis protein NfuA, 4Fe-4S-binding domain [Pustulibacterium marinum]|uniref:Fe-S cluster biogenesis protein NfuA, 4Fe-4S-binding domain n=1 Tax=Pustulibacterium marinum TaxID=1224947 RepID=A0A1I7H9M9_9FLAO|nr:NifU family protein [Pustulibacterium marinum]SFU57403.1 Fe-S cluster biogenesis protein NfuA, 4Fe-4S-binding domain [Pustulibacterium marinum]
MTQYKISIQETNNPAIIKFTANEFVSKNSFEYKNIDEAADSPLAQQLFYLPFVKTVYISGNFIAIERYNIVEWKDVSEEVGEQIENYLNSGKPVVNKDEEKKQVPATVYAESTPNPAVMKFVSNKKLVTTIWEFKNIDEASHSPLAKSLFHFPFVKEVFLDENYVSITKYDMADWGDVTMELREFIRTYIADDKEIVNENAPKKKENEAISEEHFENLDTTSQQIINIIEEYIKPAVASDGGNILFKKYEKEDNRVSVVLQGACSGCPSSTFTLKNGIENMLREMLHNPEIKVEAING